MNILRRAVATLWATESAQNERNAHFAQEPIPAHRKKLTSRTGETKNRVYLRHGLPENT